MILFKKLRFYRWYLLGRWKIKNQIKKADPLMIVLGSANTNYKGWISTDLPHFNILKENDWSFFFRFNSINNLLAEHVLEHLTEEQVEKALSIAAKYLKTKGCFRIAVPDKNHPNPEYIKFVKPGGLGAGADDHKSFWNFNTLTEIAKKYNFAVKLLEYCTKEKVIKTTNFSNKKGIIKRSLSKGFKSEIENYSSLIVDLEKIL